MGKLILVLLLCSSYSIIIGQSNFIEGTITDQSGKEINGFINYKNWVNNPKEIEFVGKVSDDSKNIYKPLEIKSFVVGDEKYISKIIDKETSSTSIGALDYDRQLNLIRDTVFLQVLIEGPKSLYYFTENSRVRNYFIGYNGEIELLRYKKFYKDVEGKKKVSVIRQYRSQLASAFFNCPEVVKKASSASYKKSSLNSLFEDYYDCSDEEIYFIRKIKKAENNFGILGGLSLVKLDFVGDDVFLDLLETDFPISMGYNLGIYFETILPRGEQRLSLKTSLNLFNYSTNDETFIDKGLNLMETNEFSFSYTYIKLNGQLKYKVYKGNFDFFLSAGLSAGYTISSRNVKKNTLVFFNDILVSERQAVRETRVDEYSWFTGFGVNKDKYTFDVIFEAGPGMSNFIRLDSNLYRLHLLLSYSF